MTSPITVLFPAPLEPTSAVVDPGGDWNDTLRRTGTSGTYSNETSSKTISPRTSVRVARPASSASSRATSRSSRMRSSPANASVICVPIDAMPTSGAATMPMNRT